MKKKVQKTLKEIELSPTERSVRRLQDQVTDLNTRLREAHREINRSEDLRGAVFSLAEQSIMPPTWMIEQHKSRHSPSVPILFTSDFQWGERISANKMDGINEFNAAIAQRRYRRLIERAIYLSFEHMVKPSYPGILYLRGGDAISGDIHQELRETNDLQSIPAVKDLVECEAWGIEQLVSKFGFAHVISIPGNHGRTTIKPMSKLYSDTNYETIAAWMLEREFKNNKRVTFWTPPSGDALFKVYGHQFLMTHGDRIGSRGGQGFIGPAATIARGMKRVRDYYANLGITIDVILVGHFHTRLELEYGFSNGSLPGASEYGRDGRMTPRPPEQWLLYVHPKWGVTCRWPIKLEGPPQLSADSKPTISFNK